MVSSWNGTNVNAPAMIPVQPNPAMARPRTRAHDVGAAPEIKDPISKIAIEARKTSRTENMNWNEQAVRRLVDQLATMVGEIVSFSTYYAE